MKSKTSQLIQFQNRMSHYNHINFAKSSIKNSLDNQNKTNSRLSNKFHHSIQRQRKIENQKLLDKLLQIHKKQSNNPSLRYFDNFEEKSLPLRRNKFKLLQKNKQRSKENYFLLIKLKNVKPLIGTKQQWSQHYDNFLQNQKKLSKPFSLRASIGQNGINQIIAEKHISRQSQHKIKLNTQNILLHKLVKNHSQNQIQDQKQSNQNIQKKNEIDMEKQAPPNKPNKLRKRKRKNEKYHSNTISTEDIIKSLKKNRKVDSQNFLELYNN